MHHNIGRIGSAYTLQKHYLQLYVERYDFFPFPRPFIVIDYFLECFLRLQNNSTENAYTVPSPQFSHLALVWYTCYNW